MKKEFYSNSVFMTLQNFTVSTVQAIIEAHMSILRSISPLVSILGAAPEMFKNLRNSDQHIPLLTKFCSCPIFYRRSIQFSFLKFYLSSPCCIGCQSMLEPGGAGSPLLCLRMVMVKRMRMVKACLIIIVQEYSQHLP